MNCLYDAAICNGRAGLDPRLPTRVSAALKRSLVHQVVFLMLKEKHATRRLMSRGGDQLMLVSTQVSLPG